MKKEDILHFKNLELATLYEISKILGSSLDIKRNLNSSMKMLSDFMGMRRGTVTLLDTETNELNIVSAYGLTKDEIERGRYKIGEGIVGKVVKTGYPVIVPDVGREPLFLNRTKSRGDIKRENISFLCVPIKVKGEILGVLSADRLFTDKRISFEEDIRVLSIVASLIGQAVKLSQIVRKEKEELIEEKERLSQELKGKYRFDNIIGQSDRMQEVFETVYMVAKSRATVLIRGESGTGKELIAKAIHYNSKRPNKPFVKVNCAALSETLLESELFGHEKGAFTGAMSERKGRFEVADGGTLFLDEIGDLSHPLQVKLLRFLQEREFERVGSSKTIKVDVRLIAATNKDLENAVREGRFRDDLYYRLNVVPIFLPPLRERRDDIPLLVEHFLERFNKENGKDVKLSQQSMDIIMKLEWRGNVRELENCIERLVVMATGKTIQPRDITYQMGSAGISLDKNRDTYTLGTLEDMERQMVIDALRQTSGVQSRAAKLLGITQRQMGYKIKKYGIIY